MIIENKKIEFTNNVEVPVRSLMEWVHSQGVQGPLTNSDNMFHFVSSKEWIDTKTFLKSFISFHIYSHLRELFITNSTVFDQFPHRFGSLCHTFDWHGSVHLTAPWSHCSPTSWWAKGNLLVELSGAVEVIGKYGDYQPLWTAINHYELLLTSNLTRKLTTSHLQPLIFWRC